MVVSNMHMKRHILMAATAAIIFAACATQPQEPENYAYLKLSEAVADGSYLYAMQDGLCYGQAWHLTDEELDADQVDKSDIRAVCGDFPAIAGFDLGEIELGGDRNLDGVVFSFMRKAALAHAERGGIVTFSWHSRNPLTGGTAWDVTSDKVAEAILPGGEKHDLYMQWMAVVADFLDSLRDADGNLIPIIWRPFHENTGSWFWWGKDLCSPEQYKALWAMMYDYLVGERGLDTMLWAYSPSSTNLLENAMERYPGDEIIDIIGVDRYAMAKETELGEEFILGMRSDLEYLSGVAADHGILLAVTETGHEGQTFPEWWTKELQPALEGFPVCYFLTWRNAWDEDHPQHWFSAFPGAPTEADFVAFHESDKTVFLSDLN